MVCNATVKVASEISDIESTYGEELYLSHLNMQFLDDFVNLV